MRTRCYPILSSPAVLLLVVSGRCMLHGAEGDSALTPDQRAGFWEAASEGNEAKASLYLELQIAKDISNVHTPTEAISGYFQEPSGRNCTFNSEDATLNKTHLLLQCLTHEGEVFVPGGRHLDITFARDGKSAAATWYEPDEILSLTLRRPSFDAGSSPLIGEWVARGVAQTCVLHVFARTKPDPMLDLIDPLKLLVSLDIFSSGGATYGRDMRGLDYRPEDGLVEFSLQGTGTSMFVGHLGQTRERITGGWSGGSVCGDVFERSK